MINKIATESYQYDFFTNGYQFNISGKYERRAKNLFCTKTPNAEESMEFLKYFPNLETIDARSCGISNIDYDAHINVSISLLLDRLHSADFSHNQIENIEKNSFFSLQNGLQKLNLSNNIITHFSPEAFNFLRKLEILDLSNNSIAHIKLTSFKDLDQLKEFYFANNQLLGVQFNLFSYSRHLQILNFSSNQIEVLAFPATAAVWESLTTLDLSNNRIYHLDRTTKFKRS
jgi:Leucine rich repeat/Leucine Rich repeat